MGQVRSHNERPPRIDLRRPAIMVDSDGVEWNVIVLDLSSHGFRLEVPECPRIGELITLRVDRGLELSAEIRWVLGHEAGASFAGLSDLREVAQQKEKRDDDGKD